MGGLQGVQVLAVKLVKLFGRTGIILYTAGNTFVRRINHLQYFVRFEQTGCHYRRYMRSLHPVKPFRVNGLINYYGFVIDYHIAPSKSPPVGETFLIYFLKPSLPGRVWVGLTGRLIPPDYPEPFPRLVNPQAAGVIRYNFLIISFCLRFII
jgi:hypothetical protein